MAGEYPDATGTTTATWTTGTKDAVDPAPPAKRKRPRLWARSRKYRIIVRSLLVLALIPVLLTTAGLAWLGDQGSASPPATIPATGGDGLWLGHAWVAGTQTSADLNLLVTRVKQDGIKDLFVHDGPLSANGSLDPRLSPDARTFVATVHKRLPGVRVQAWLGDLVGPGNLNLDSPATRSRILGSVDQALADGFDGIHFDMEPVPSGDQGYLDLLAATHQLTSQRHKILSISAELIEPLSGLGLPASIIAGQSHYWSASYLSALARNVDEVALMAYNTIMPFATDYSGFVRLETGIALRAVPPGVHLLIGLPAYPTALPAHTGAETVANGIRGVRLALGTSSQPRNIGVSMYADFTATQADWAAYRTDWSAVRRS
ncbi:MAG TPA: hypothetical protein VMU95_02790 [Trebonia sp.]|nr:hypothetical protein [Trebonia sp.]